MTKAMTKTELKQKLNAQTDAQLARFFRTTRQAVAQWKEGAVPDGRVWEARARRPDLFRVKRQANN